MSANAVLEQSEFVARLKSIGRERYHHQHPFHLLMHEGKLTRGQLQAWALNRYYYQSMIPVKDAAIMARSHDPEFRRAWRKRIIDHDGVNGKPGGIERWIQLAVATGLERQYVISGEGVLPAVKYAVGAYVQLVRERTLLEAVASSLTELFSPAIISERIEGMLNNYDFVTSETLAYFSQRPPQAERDSRFALDYVKVNARTAEAQRDVLRALEFKCDVLWAMLDALYHAYVAPRHIPPGAFAPQD